MKYLTTGELNQARLDRRELEVSVATAIGRYLMQKKRNEIQGLTNSILYFIYKLQYNAKLFCGVHGFLKTQTKYVMWKLCNTDPALGFSSLNQVAKYLDSNLLKDSAWLIVCSDVIRLFGELAEDKSMKDFKSVHWGTMAKKDELRPYPIFNKPLTKKDFEKKDYKPERAFLDSGEVCRDYKSYLGALRAGNLKEPIHRDRGFNRPDNIEIVEAPFMPIADRENVELRGVERFKFESHSVIENIDWTYGLQIEGADISGTTTDSISALRWAQENTGISEDIAQLIAIATMVPQGHHTLVECAWPLTRNGYMNYEIGFYDSLVQDGKGSNDLKNYLRFWNNDARNKHILVCRGNNNMDVMGFHFITAREKEEYRKLAGVRSAYSFCVAGFPRFNSLVNLMRAHHVSPDVLYLVENHHDPLLHV